MADEQKNDEKLVTWLSQDNILEQYATMLVMTLPGDRLSYYKTSDVSKMRSNIYSIMNDITLTLGFYPVKGTNTLLNDMQLFNFAILFIGLVFSIVIILFVIISILLIYSLLMITTETKTFDIGVMRLIGLSSSGFVSMIFI